MDDATARSTLGVGPHAGLSELRRAFRLRSKATHPDLSGSEEEFAAVQAAYAFLAERVTAPTPWWLEDADAPKFRVASEQPPPPRGRFETMFREAIRKQRSS